MDGEEGKREGMDRAKRHADPHWWQCMIESTRAICRQQPYFNADDVVAMCRTNHPNASTHERRAVGPVIRDAARLGHCEPTDQWTPSTQPQCHKRPMRTWYSLTYSGAHPVPRPPRRKLLDPRKLRKA